MMTAFPQATVALVIGGAQCGLIYVGLRYMGEAAADRRSQHEETMTVLPDQREFTCQQGAALADIGAGIQELLQRSTSPPSPSPLRG